MSAVLEVKYRESRLGYINPQLRTAVGKTDDGSGVGRSGVRDVTWTFATSKAARAAAARVKSRFHSGVQTKVTAYDESGYPRRAKSNPSGTSWLLLGLGAAALGTAGWYFFIRKPTPAPALTTGTAAPLSR